MQNTLPPEFEMDLFESVKYLKKYKKILDKENNLSQDKELNKFFDSIWKLYPKKTNKGSIKLSAKKEVMSIGYDTMKLAIQKYIHFIQNQKRSGFNQQYQGGDRFFNRETYKDYLPDKNQISIEDVSKLKPTFTCRKKDL